MPQKALEVEGIKGNENCISGRLTEHWGGLVGLIVLLRPLYDYMRLPLER